MNLIELVNPKPQKIKVILTEGQTKRLIKNLKKESNTQNAEESKTSKR